MSRYVLIFTEFYTNRKTLRLKAHIGEAAFWVPPRLWAYAADNQVDGNFTDYSDAELGSVIEYPGDASSMRQALVQVGFLDPDQHLHDWQEHNGYHQEFVKRASKAANARWSKERKDKKPVRDTDRVGKEPSNASSIPSRMREGSTPKSTEKVEWKPTPLQRRLGALVKRKSTAPWTREQQRLLKFTGDIQEQDLALLESYYQDEKHRLKDTRCRKLTDLVLHLQREIAKARAFKPQVPQEQLRRIKGGAALTSEVAYV